MTVCIAAICEDGILLGASDRMVTWGDIQFEPQTPKIRTITTSITVMTSGDAAFQTEFLQDVYAEVAANIDANPAHWHGVREIVEMIVRHRNEAKLRRAESALLAPLGIDKHAFAQGFHGLNADLVRSITIDMMQFAVPHTACIVSGIDPTGAHIYTVMDGVISCNDAVGFAAIGMGARHAESQFMLAAHHAGASLADTLLLIYTAKKRSEIAPGVGRATDMFTAGHNLGSVTPIGEEVMQQVDREFKAVLSKELVARKHALQGMREYVDNLVSAATAKIAPQSPESEFLAEDGSGQSPKGEAA